MEKKVTFYEERFPSDVAKIITPVRIENITGSRFFECEALWDTGAERTVIADCLAKSLRLDTLPFATMNTPAGEMDVEMGAVLVFPGNKRRFVSVITAVMDGPYSGQDCIIGMDVIRKGGFSLRREGAELVFRFDFGDGFRQK